MRFTSRTALVADEYSFGTYRLRKQASIPGRVRLVDKRKTLVVEMFLRLFHYCFVFGRCVDFVWKRWGGHFVMTTIDCVFFVCACSQKRKRDGSPSDDWFRLLHFLLYIKPSPCPCRINSEARLALVYCALRLLEGSRWYHGTIQ